MPEISFPPLPKQRFGLLVIDPPWQYRSRSNQGAAERHYRTVATADLAKLNVARVAAEDSLLVMWTTSSMLLEHADTDLISAWGFEPKSLHTWLKLTNLNQLHFGVGYFGHHCEEYFIVASRGRPDFTGFRKSRTVHAWAYPGIRASGLHAKGVHSSKPSEFYKWCEQVYPCGRILELFARDNQSAEARGGRWTRWGEQA